VKLATALRKLEVFPAWVFTCNDCGKDTFVRSVVAEMSQEEREEQLRVEMKLELWEPIPEGTFGEWTTYPTTLKCDHCKAEFESEHYSDSEDIDG
jgi:transcription elongation factor Elf1